MKSLTKSCVIGLAIVGLTLFARPNLGLAQYTLDPNYISGVAATASSSWGGSGPIFLRDIRHTVDGTDRDTATPDDGTLTPNDGKGMWMSEGRTSIPPDGVTPGACGGEDCNPFAKFDLGAVTTLTRVDIYNYNESCCNNRGIATMNVSHSVDDVNYTFLGNFPVDIAPGQNVPFPASASIPFLNADARYVLFDGFTSQGNGDVVGLNEVEFYGNLEPTDTYEWSLGSTGSWHVGENWDRSAVPSPSSGVPDALFGSSITSPQVVTTVTDVQVRGVEFDNSESYAIAGHGTVVLTSSSSTIDQAIIDPSITVTSGSHEFQTPVQLSAATGVDVAASSTLTFNNALNLNGNTLTKTGGGTMTVNNNLTLGASGSVDCQDGTCNGTGTIAGNLNNTGGIVSPGNSWQLPATSVASVPEPASFVTLSIAVALLSLRRRSG